jgi:hypothetical protein
MWGLQENWVGFYFKLEGQRKGKRVQKEVEIHDIDHAIMEWHNILPQWSSTVLSQSEHGWRRLNPEVCAKSEPTLGPCFITTISVQSTSSHGFSGGPSGLGCAHHLRTQQFVRSDSWRNCGNNTFLSTMTRGPGFRTPFACSLLARRFIVLGSRGLCSGCRKCH